MGLSLVRGHRWPALLDQLAELLRAQHTDPFARARVLVSSRATGRIVGQEIAARLGISAGIDYLTPAAMMARFAEAAGVAADRSRWLGSPLDLATWDAIEAIAPRFPVLERAAAVSRPGGRRATATRLARLQRWYLDHAPELVSAWLSGHDGAPDGSPLPERLAWQPALLRAAVEALEVDPLETLAAILEAAAADPVPTHVLAVDELTAPQLRTIEALAAGPGVVAVQPFGSPGEAWAGERATQLSSLPGEPLPAPLVELHDSHGPARQVEVLRDALTAAFEADPTLEPRQVAIVCPQPARYSRLLDAAFAPSELGGHPGRTLRVQDVSGAPDNPVLTATVQLLRLGELRATASELLELLLSAPLAHRWRLNDREAVTELVSGAGVHWGMDAAHRASFDLADVGQSTWMRGLDRLLVGLAVAPGDDAGLGLTGSDSVTASDLDTVGALCEVVSRLRRLIAETASPTTVPGWVSRTRRLLEDFMSVPWQDEGQLLQVRGVLARFEADHAASPTLLSRHEFAHLLRAACRSARARVAAGNGSLLVAPLGELSHVEFRLVAMLGITDDVVPGTALGMPDAVDLGAACPDERESRLRRLLMHATSAERLILVRQHRSPRTDDEISPPAAVSWLLDQLGAHPEPRQHPATATAEENFAEPASFDQDAWAGALARRNPPRSPTLRSRRRSQARSRQRVDPWPTQVTLTQLQRFLADPAKAFLRVGAGIPLYETPSVSDEIPLSLTGLERWGVVTALLDSLKAGASLESVVRQLRSREELPPDEIGRREFEGARDEVALLWAGADGAWHRQVTDHQLDLLLDVDGVGPVRVVDSVRCRGGQALDITASSGEDKLIRPWLESLALTASGTPFPGRLLRLRKERGQKVLADTQVGVQDAARAGEQLATVVRAYCLGQHRLIPAPALPAITYAREATRRAFTRADWSGAPGWRHPKWANMSEAWRLFYDDEVSELLHDELLPEDPHNAQPSAFQAWAVALYSGLTSGGAADA